MHIIFTFMMGLTNPALADGACCLEDYSCTTESADVCDRYGGAYYDAASCSDVFAECEGLADTTGDPTGASGDGDGGDDATGTDDGSGADPEVGACCIDDTCTVLDEDTCKEALGDWWGGADCDDPDVECETDIDETGACCIEDTCYEVPMTECHSSGGYWYSAGSDCSDLFVECEAPAGDTDGGTTDAGTSDAGATDGGGTDEPELGACCVDGTCSELDYDTCKDLLGTWWPGSGCGDPWVECEPAPETGACCVEDACYDMTADECEDRAGYWYGIGVDCSDPIVECEPPPPTTGACCIDDTCFDITIYECHASAGAWYGIGIDCADPIVECETGGDETGGDETGGDETGGDETGGDETGGDDDPGACCIDGECIEMVDEKCWEEGGVFYGPGTDCDDDFVDCCDESDTGHLAGDDGGSDDDGGTTGGDDDGGTTGGSTSSSGGCSTIPAVARTVWPALLVTLMALITTRRRPNIA